MTTLLILAHPNFAASRANRALLHGLEGLPDLEIADLYALYPDGKIDFPVERTRLLRADRLVLQFPFYWYSVPPLLKQWMDSVLTPLFYLEPEVAASMKGLPVFVATTTGGPAANYRPEGMTGATMEELFAPLRATAGRCGWQWRKPLAVHDVRNLDDAALARAGAVYRAALQEIPVRVREVAAEA